MRHHSIKRHRDSTSTIPSCFSKGKSGSFPIVPDIAPPRPYLEFLIDSRRRCQIFCPEFKSNHKKCISAGLRACLYLSGNMGANSSEAVHKLRFRRKVWVGGFPIVLVLSTRNQNTTQKRTKALRKFIAAR